MAKRRNPTKRVKEELTALGYAVGDCETFVYGKKLKKDMFGWVDLVAVGNGHVYFIQACAETDISKRYRKILEQDAENGSVSKALEAGVRCSVFALTNDDDLVERKVTKESFDEEDL